MTGPRFFRPIVLTWTSMPPGLRLSFVRGLDDSCEARSRVLRQTDPKPSAVVPEPLPRGAAPASGLS